MNYTEKYFKYKNKYLKLKGQTGGNDLIFNLEKYLDEATNIYIDIEKISNEKVYIGGIIGVLYYLFDKINNQQIKGNVNNIIKYIEENSSSLKINELDVYIINNIDTFINKIYINGEKSQNNITTESSSNIDKLNCNDNDKLIIINSHYTQLPISQKPIFYKCNEKNSLYNKINIHPAETNNVIIMNYKGKYILIENIRI